MPSSDVLVIVNNYLRPHNLPEVLAAWRAQELPPAKLLVADNSPKAQTPETYPNPRFELADDVWRFQENQGCSARFAPALLNHTHAYTLLVDDDYLPGPKALNRLLADAAYLKDKFATLSQQGRRFSRSKRGDYSYEFGTPDLGNEPQEIDLTVRAQFFRTELLHHAFSMRAKLLQNGAGNLVDIHDDFQLCAGIQMGTGWPSYLIASSSEECRPILKKLDESQSVHHRAGHKEERNLMLRLCLKAGWRLSANQPR